MIHFIVGKFPIQCEPVIKRQKKNTTSPSSPCCCFCMRIHAVIPGNCATSVDIVKCILSLNVNVFFLTALKRFFSAPARLNVRFRKDYAPPVLSVLTFEYL